MPSSLPPLGAAAIALAGSVLFCPDAPGIEIEIRYSFDSNNFFSDQTRRDALRAVCDVFEDAITDSLAAIVPTGESTWTPEFTNPGTGGTATIPGNPTIPADTIILYAGGRPLGGDTVGVGGFGGFGASGFQPWFDLIEFRGQSQAGNNFVIWGGSVSFDSDRSWNFSTTGTGPGTDFVPVALHELAHVFGFGIASEFTSQISGGNFVGANAVAAFGGGIPVEGGGGHWAQTVENETLPLFQTPQGITQTALMAPTLFEFAQLSVMTTIDFEALRDIGWEINLPTSLEAPSLAVSVNPNTGQVSLSWPSMNGVSYQVQESATLSGWSNFGSALDGNGGTLTRNDNAPPSGRNFYRVVATGSAPPPPPAALNASQPAPQPAALSAPADSVPIFQFSKPPRYCADCKAPH